MANIKENRKLYNFLIVCVYSIFSFFAFILSVLSLMTTQSYYSTTASDNNYFVLIHDNPGLNLLAFGLALALTIIIYFCTRKARPVFFEITAALLAVISFAAMVVLVHEAGSKPYWDPMQVFVDALAFKHGNYSDMRGYLDMYVQQYGLLLYEEILTSVFKSYRFIQYVNAFLAASSIYAIYRISIVLFKEKSISLISAILAFVFIPIYFYSTFVYGDIPSLAFELWGIWFILMFVKTKKVGFAISGCAFLSIAFMVRSNAIIMTIALAISLCVYWLISKKKRMLILTALVLILPLLLSFSVRKTYELRSHTKIGKGIPVTGWIMMGMEDSGYGAGAFNGNSESIYINSVRDREFANLAYKNAIGKRFNEFVNEPYNALVFYKNKISQQWNEGTYGSIIQTSTFDEGFPKGVAKNLYYGFAATWIYRYCNHMIFVLYVSFLIYIVLLKKQLKSIKNNENIYKIDEDATFFEYLPMIAFIGGMLFSILWEAKPRYVFPYVFFAIPLAAASLTNLAKLIMGFREKNNIIATENGK